VVLTMMFMMMSGMVVRVNVFERRGVVSAESRSRIVKKMRVGISRLTVFWHVLAWSNSTWCNR